MLPIWAIPIPVLIAKSCPALNPFVYVLCTNMYRKRLSKLIQNWICFSESSRKEQRITQDRNEISKDMKSISEHRLNKNFKVEIHVNSLEVHEIDKDLSTFEYGNEDMSFV